MGTLPCHQCHAHGGLWELRVINNDLPLHIVEMCSFWRGCRDRDCMASVKHRNLVDVLLKSRHIAVSGSW
eukprot:jgi/Mesen1/633/ME000108S10793